MSDASIGDMVGGNDSCPEIVFRGKKYAVGRPDQKAKARLEKLAAAVAINEVRALKDVLPADAYQEAFGAVTKNLKSYRTWQPGWQAVVFEPANGYLFLASLMPDVPEETVKGICHDSPEEVNAALAQVIPDFFDMLLTDLKDHLSAEQMEAVRVVLQTLRERLIPTQPTSST